TAVSEVLPRAACPTDIRLAAQLTLGADLASYSRNFRGERIQLVHHDVDRVLEFEDFTADVYGDLLGKIALCHRGTDLSDVADLGGQVAGHEVHIVGEVLPGTGYSSHFGLPAEFALGTDFSHHSGYFRSEPVHLIDHSIDRIL